MRLRVLIAAICILTPSLANAQWLEKRILLPDSFGGMSRPQCFTYNATNNTMYVGSGYGDGLLTEGCVIAIDGATNQKTARIPTGRDVKALCHNPINNKVYSANNGSDNVTVIDGTSNTVIATVAVGDAPCALCYNPTNNKVYSANYSSGNVTVIDGASDAVVATVAVGSSPVALCYNPVNNKVYSTPRFGGNATVIDGAGDTVIATVAVGSTLASCYNPVNNKVYSASDRGNVAVIDGASDTVIATVAVGSTPVALCYNPVDNKVYSANRSSNNVTVIDGASDAVVATVAVGTYPVALCYNPANNKVYSANQSFDVTVIDGASDTVIATVAVGRFPEALCYNPANNKVYAANYNNSNVTVIDGASDTVIATVAVGATPLALCYNPVSKKVYSANGYSDNVTVIDDASDTIIATVADGDYPRALCYNPANNKVYSANGFSGNVTVLDGASDTVIATVAADGPVALCYNPTNNKVYSANYSSNNVTVLDGASDTVIATVAVGNYPSALCYNPVNNKVYSANYGSSNVTVLDGASNTVIATVATGRAPMALCYNPANNKVYSANSSGGNVTVIDGAGDTVIATVAAAYASALCYNPDNNRVYSADQVYDNVYVIDGASDTVIATVAVGDYPSALCYDPFNNRVYSANRGGDNVSVIDGASDTVIATVAVGDQPVALYYNPERSLVYCANCWGSSISVIKYRLEHDVGVVEVVAPKGIVRSDTIIAPAAIVRNSGSGAASFPTVMNIGPFYSETLQVLLLQDSLDTLYFPNWQASPPGTYCVRCSTLYVADQVPGNDFQDTVVVVGTGTLAVTSVSPGVGGDNGWVTSEVRGHGFDSGTFARLERTGQPPIGGAWEALPCDSGRFMARFDLRGQQRGRWNLVVSNSARESVVFFDGFQIDPGRKDVWTAILARDVVRRGRWEYLCVDYQNTGNVDIDSCYFALRSLQAEPLRPDTNAQPQVAVAFPVFSQRWPWLSLAPGGRGRVTLQVGGVESLPHVDLTLKVLYHPGELGVAEATGESLDAFSRVPSVPAWPASESDELPRHRTAVPRRSPGSTQASSVYLTIDDVTNGGTLDLIRAAQEIVPGVKVACFVNIQDQSPEAFASRSLFGNGVKNPSDGMIFHRDVARQLVDGGHLIGYHGFYHLTCELGRLPPDQVWADFVRWQVTMDEIEPRWRPTDGRIPVRFPGWTASPEVEQRFGDHVLTGGYTVHDIMIRISDMLGGLARQWALDHAAQYAVDQAKEHRAVRPEEPFTLVVHQDFVTPDDLKYILRKLRDEGFELATVDKTALSPYPEYGNSVHRPQEHLADAESLLIVNSWDPNEKSSPAGVGVQRWFRLAAQPLPYTVYFENVDSATAPAETVVVTDRLDNNLDWSTLILDTVSHPAVCRTELDSVHRTITWRFDSIMLPPNRNPPEGEGFCQFSVSPRQGLLSGAQIRNCATIVFDRNPPMNTDTVLNTIDAFPPTSSVRALPETTQTGEFTVRWTGTDDLRGSGIQSYDIYAKRDTCDFAPWLVGTTDTSATFIGANESRYWFYSVATDNVGWREDTPTNFDAQTLINGMAAPVMLRPPDTTFTNDTAPSFFWTATAGTHGTYVLQFSRDSQFGVGTESITGLTDTGYTIADTSALSDTTWFWRVKAIGRRGTPSTYRDTWCFTVDTRAPETPDLLAPQDSSTTNDPTPAFVWSSETEPGCRYFVLCALDTGFTEAVAGTFTSDTMYTVPDARPLEDTFYFWHARAVDRAGNAGAYQPRPFTFTVCPLRSVSGDVTYYGDSTRVVDSARMVMFGDMHDTVYTAGGYYEFVGVANRSNDSVTPEKTNAARQAAVTAFDAAMVLQHAVHIDTLDSFQFIAGDVSGDTTASAYDAGLILQYAVGASRHFPVGYRPGRDTLDWAFCPPLRPYTPCTTSYANEDYLAILYGDPSGNWPGMGMLASWGDVTTGGRCTYFTVNMPGGGSTNDQATMPIQVPRHKVQVPASTGGAPLAVSRQPFAVGGEPLAVSREPSAGLVFPLKASKARNVVSADALVRYDAKRFTLNAIRTTPATEGFMVAAADRGGCVRIAMAGTRKLNGDVALLELVFESAERTAKDAKNAKVPVTLSESDESKGLRGDRQPVDDDRRFFAGAQNDTVSAPEAVSREPLAVGAAFEVVWLVLNEGASDAADRTGEGAMGDEKKLPTSLYLAPPKPNPFGNGTSISYGLPAATEMALAVFDATGRKVRTLVSGHQPAGRYVAVWDGRDNAGRRLATGIYFVRMKAANASFERKATLVRN